MYVMNRGVSRGCKRVEQMSRVLLESSGMIRDALSSGQAVFREKVTENEAKLNTWEMEIEDDFISVVATQRPVATDLRYVAASLKIIDHLERIGDYQIHIMDVLEEIKGVLVAEMREKFVTMATVFCQMLEKTITAYAEGNDTEAREAAELDTIIDTHYTEVLHELYNCIGSPMTRTELGKHLMLLKYVERSADHVTDIDEWIVYAIESIHVQLNS